MDLCVVDWKAVVPILAALIAACIASFTAFCISNRWNNQKGSEALAAEAKTLYSLNNDIFVLYKNLRDSILESPGTVGMSHKDFKNLKEGLDNLINELKYFKELLKISNSPKSNEFVKLTIKVENFKKRLDRIQLYKIRTYGHSQGSHANEIFNELGFDSFVDNIRSINLILFKVILYK